jgi:squalene-hopene/tetraprenyl-beta-curcumene cyclase
MFLRGRTPFSYSRPSAVKSQYIRESMRRLATGLFLFLAVLSVGRASPAQVTTAVPGGWNRQAAAAFLDRRMDDWFVNGDKLRTGEGRTTCVSCHTVIPYALARPALRRAMRVSQPTPQEARLVDETSRRVQTYDAHQLLYDFDEEKKGESRGTEAVVYALILASANAGQAREPGDATRRAMARLWEMQRADGAWEWLDVGLEPFESIDSMYVGAAWAALAAGMTPALSSGADARAGIEKLRNYLGTQYSSQNLHNRIWGRLAFTSLREFLTGSKREEPGLLDNLVGELQGRQRADGGWSLDGLGGWRWNRTTAPFQSPGARDVSLAATSDGYATGLIVYTLRQAGLPIEHPVIKKGLQWLRVNQLPVRAGDREWPAWRAHSLNYDREHGGSRGEPWRRLFMSDAATAFASLALLAASE